MGKIIKILQASDLHDNPDFGKLRSIHELIRKEGNICAAFLLGDFFNEQRYASIGSKSQNAVQQRAFQQLSDQEKQLMQLEILAKQMGGIENIKIALPNLPGEQREQMRKFVFQYEANKEQLILAFQKFNKIYRTFSKEAKSVDDVIKEMEAMFQSDISVFDSIIGEFGVPVYGVRGNWDPDQIYQLKNMHFVEKQPIQLEGLNIAGVPGWYEKVRIIPNCFYKDVEIEPTNQEIEELLQENEKEAKNLIENNQVLKRLKDQSIDILVAHKGPHALAEDLSGSSNYGYGYGLGRIVEEKKPKIVLGGHIHQSLFDGTHNYQGVRSGDEKAYVLHIDAGSSKIVQIDKYKYKQITADLRE